MAMPSRSAACAASPRAPVAWQASAWHSFSTWAPGGSFRQLTVMPWVYYPLYRRYFTDLKFRFVPLNLPPGGVYICQGFQPRD